MSTARFRYCFGLLATAGAAPARAAAIPPASLPADNLLDRTVSGVRALFDSADGGNAIGHYIAAVLLVAAGLLLRRVITHVIFGWLKRLAAKTTTTLDDKLFPALEAPVGALVFVFLTFAGVKVLVLSPRLESLVGYAFNIAWVAVIFWGMLRALNAVVDHLHETAREKDLDINHFMPLIKKTLGVIFVIMAGLTIAQRMGVDVKTFLAGLGIGGLAFALAAQDTLANFFGSLVVVVDRPFRVGDLIQVGPAEGRVEDIGLRSTKIRTAARTLIIMPNKAVANEAVTNFSRMPQRRVDQTIGLTYTTTPEQMQGILEDIRGIIRNDPAVDQELIAVNFTDYNASSLDIKIVYFAANPDWLKHLELRERINLKIMAAVNARGLSFAFPTQTLHVEDDVARKLAGAGGKSAVFGS